MVKTKLLLLFTSFGEQQWFILGKPSDGDCDRFGLPFIFPFVLGKRHFAVLHFNPFFHSFPLLIRFLWKIL